MCPFSLQNKFLYTHLFRAVNNQKRDMQANVLLYQEFINKFVFAQISACEFYFTDLLARLARYNL